MKENPEPRYEIEELLREATPPLDDDSFTKSVMEHIPLHHRNYLPFLLPVFAYLLAALLAPFEIPRIALLMVEEGFMGAGLPVMAALSVGLIVLSMTYASYLMGRSR